MSESFFERPILNSPYEAPAFHHPLGSDGQPLDVPPIAGRRRSALITPVPKPRKRKAKGRQGGFVFEDELGLSSAEQEYNPTPIINEIRSHMKNTGKGNLFVVFGEPDIDIEPAGDGEIRVRVKGVDVFDPNTGEIRSNDTKGIAAWLIDTDYNEESFFVRHAYFLGAQDPYKSLKSALKAEVDEDAWATLYRDVSRPFPHPSTGRIAVKVINHFGDEVMKVFPV